MEDWITKERPKEAHLYTAKNLIFPDASGRVPGAQAPRREFKAMLLCAGLTYRSRFRWYDLRHTHATLLLTKVVPPHEVARRMGHSAATLMTTYAHVLPGRDEIAAQTFQDLVPMTDDVVPPSEES